MKYGKMEISRNQIESLLEGKTIVLSRRGITVEVELDPDDLKDGENG